MCWHLVWLKTYNAIRPNSQNGLLQQQKIQRNWKALMLQVLDNWFSPRTFDLYWIVTWNCFDVDSVSSKHWSLQELFAFLSTTHHKFNTYSRIILSNTSQKLQRFIDGTAWYVILMITINKKIIQLLPYWNV